MSTKATEKSFRNKNNSVGDIISIGDIILILAKNIIIITVIPFIICTLTIIYAIWFTTPTMFLLLAKIMSSSPQSTSKMAGLASQFGIDLPTGQSEPNWVYDGYYKK